MKKRVFFVIMSVVTVFSIISCGSSKVMSYDTPENKASIYIKRPSFVGAIWMHCMDINGIFVSNVGSGDCIRIDVDPGAYTLNYYNLVPYEYIKNAQGPSFTKTFYLKAGEKRFVDVVIKPKNVSCVDVDGKKGFKKINSTIDFSLLENSHKEDILVDSPQLPKDEPIKQVEGLGTTALEQTIVRWEVNSRPQGADIFWRVVSKTPDVKSTNNKYLTTTPYEATKSLDIKGLTYQTAGDVRIILRCEKEGYYSQEKEFNARMVIDQEEISAFFRLVKEDEQ